MLSVVCIISVVLSVFLFITAIIVFLSSQNTNTSSSNDWITLFSLFELCATSTTSHSQRKSPSDQTDGAPPTSTQPEMGVVTEEDPNTDKQESSLPTTPDSTTTVTNNSIANSTVTNNSIANSTAANNSINSTATNNSIKDVPVQKPTSSGINCFDLLVEEHLPQQVSNCMNKTHNMYCLRMQQWRSFSYWTLLGQLVVS